MSICGFLFLAMVVGFLPWSVRPASGQEKKYRFERLSVEHGLSHSIVYSIVQDKVGFLWFATQHGLNRYNGYEFAVFRSDPADSGTVSSDDISLVYEDHEGKFWLATWGGGLNLFDPHTERFTRFRHRPGDSTSICDNRIQAIQEDRSGNLWIGTMNGLSRFDRSTRTFRNYYHVPGDPNSLSHNRVWSLLEDATGRLWVGTNKGLGYYDAHSRRFERYAPGEATGSQDDIVRSLYQDRQREIWIGKQDGLQRLAADRRTRSAYRHRPDDPTSMSGNIVNCIYEDRFGSIWVGTNGSGLNEFNRRTGSFRRFRNDPHNPTTISADDIRAVYEDRAGTLWIATRGGGLNKLTRNAEKITHFFHDDSDPRTISSNAIRSVRLDSRNRLWIGTDGEGLNAWSEPEGRMVHYRSDRTRPGSLTNDYIYCIVESRDGGMWIGTREGLNRWDPVSGRFTLFSRRPLDPVQPAHDRITALHEDPRGRLWIGTYGGGLDMWDPTAERLVHYHPGETAMYGWIGAILTSRDGTLWVGTQGGGLYRKTRDRDDFVIYRADPYAPSSLSHNTVNALYEDSSGVLWIATEGGGLNAMNPAAGTFTRFTERDGLAHDVVYGILPDRRGHLWLSTNNGLSKFSVATRTCVNYYDNDGFQGNVYNPNAYAAGAEGAMYFGGINGLNLFHPDDLQSNEYTPPVVLTTFKRFDKPVPFGFATSDVRELDLSYRDYYIAFEFAALDFVHPAKNQYAYMLEGFDADWIYCGSRRFASYTNLEGGDYVFRVRGSNNDLKWNEAGFAIRIHVEPPWWGTWWFRIGSVLTVVLGVYAGIRRRIGAIEAHRRELESEVQQRTHELKEQRDELEKTLRHLRETQAHLLQTEKMASIGHLTAGMAHEINNPLSFIDGNLNHLETYLRDITRMIEDSETVLRSADTGLKEKIDALRAIRSRYDYEYIVDDITKTIQSCKNGSERIQKIIRDLRSFANIDDSQLRYSDLLQGLETTLSLLKHKLAARIDIKKEYASLPEVLCFPGLLNQVFMNLILNAIQAIPYQGAITLRARSLSAEEIEISVEDTGCGIPENIRSRIFDPFFTTKEVGEGTGLGLSVSYAIVEKHYGSLTCESEEGRGSTFVVRLPVHSAQLRQHLLSKSQGQSVAGAAGP